jgi:glucokinase
VYRIGVDLGGTSTKIALVGSDGRILAHCRQASARGQDARLFFRLIRAALEELAAAAGQPYPPRDGGGIGLPGIVEATGGRVRFSGPLGWKDVEVGSIATEALGCEVAVDNDVNAGALADLWFGEAVDANDMLYVAWGTGIGAAFVVGRSLYHSRGAAMGNFGHMPADFFSHRRCYCGCLGCLEIEAGGQAMVEQVRHRIACGEKSILRETAETMTPEHIAAAAAAGDGLARSVLERSAVLMARALAGVLAFLNPDTVIFGGGVSHCLPLVWTTFEEELQRRTPSFSLPLTRLRQSRFGANAGVVGASLLLVNNSILR